MKDFAEKLHESRNKDRDYFVEELRENLNKLPERVVELMWAFAEGMLTAQRLEQEKTKNKVK